MKHLWMGILASVYIATTNIAGAQSPSTVLVVANANNAQSLALADHYLDTRQIPINNLLVLNWDANDNADTCTLAYYNTNIATPIYARIRQLPRIDYIVLCRNLPIKIRETGGSVDSALAGRTTAKRCNPYYYRNAPFSSYTYGMYMVTRLDGWSWKDANALIDRAAAATRGGQFVFDCDPSKDASLSYAWYNASLKDANSQLVRKGLSSRCDTTYTFVNPGTTVAGYSSWGSNDAKYLATVYNALRFRPGAIVETAVSTSAYNLRYPGGWQSQISTLIQNGVTGVKGYVAEPLLSATARPGILFPWYTSGRNLAESFYGASAYLGWRDVVVGDPLCAPYR